MGIAVTDSLPSSAVSFLHSRVTVISFVPLVLFLGMLITEPSVTKVRTTGIRAGTLWFPWHLLHLLVHKKSPAGCCTHKACFHFFYNTIILLMAVPIYGKVCQPYSGTIKFPNADAWIRCTVRLETQRRSEISCHEKLLK